MSIQIFSKQPQMDKNPKVDKMIDPYQNEKGLPQSYSMCLSASKALCGMKPSAGNFQKIILSGSSLHSYTTPSVRCCCFSGCEAARRETRGRRIKQQRSESPEVVIHTWWRSPPSTAAAWTWTTSRGMWGESPTSRFSFFPGCKIDEGGQTARP